MMFSLSVSGGDWSRMIARIEASYWTTFQRVMRIVSCYLRVGVFYDRKAIETRRN